MPVCLVPSAAAAAKIMLLCCVCVTEARLRPASGVDKTQFARPDFAYSLHDAETSGSDEPMTAVRDVDSW